MDTSKMESLYQKIAATVNEMIPQDWAKVLTYAETREGYAAVYFYYYPTGSDTPIYSLDIPDHFSIDQQKHAQLEDQLFEYFRELWYEFKAQGQEQWTSVTFILDRSGKFKMDFTYEDLSQMGPSEKRKLWKEKYLDHQAKPGRNSMFLRSIESKLSSLFRKRNNI